MIKFCADVVNFITGTFALLGFIAIMVGISLMISMNGVTGFGVGMTAAIVAGAVFGFYVVLGLFSLLGGIYENQKELIALAKKETV